MCRCSEAIVIDNEILSLEACDAANRCHDDKLILAVRIVKAFC